MKIQYMPMPKKDINNNNKPDRSPSNEAHNKAVQAPTDHVPTSPNNQSLPDHAANKHQLTHHKKKPILAQPGNRTPKKKLVFADPISHQRIYERPSNPNDDDPNYRQRSLSKTMRKGSAIDDLQPPYNLIASLDIAAKKLDARGPSLSHKSTASTSSHTMSATSHSNIVAQQSSKSVDHTSTPTTSPTTTATTTIINTKKH